MLQAKGRRGRPKGTGIDDSDRIARLAELISIYPELRPTTAIRKMGISDPSVIRRLRDKYHAFVSGKAYEQSAVALNGLAPAPAATSDAVPATRH